MAKVAKLEAVASTAEVAKAVPMITAATTRKTRDKVNRMRMLRRTRIFIGSTTKMLYGTRILTRTTQCAAKTMDHGEGVQLTDGGRG